MASVAGAEQWGWGMWRRAQPGVVWPGSSVATVPHAAAGVRRATARGRIGLESALEGAPCGTESRAVAHTPTPHPTSPHSHPVALQGRKVMRVRISPRDPAAAAQPPPAPSNPAVGLDIAGGEIVAVVRFEGNATPEVAAAQRRRLEAALAAGGHGQHAFRMRGVWGLSMCQLGSCSAAQQL